MNLVLFPIASWTSKLQSDSALTTTQVQMWKCEYVKTDYVNLPGKKHLFSSEEIQTLELVGTVKVNGQAEKIK